MNKDVVVDVVREVLVKLLGVGHEELLEELCAILALRIIDPKESLAVKSFEVRHPDLTKILGPSVRLTPSEHQLSSVSILRKIYTSSDDLVNKLIYHLRPKNTTLQVSYPSRKDAIAQEPSS